MTKYNFVPFLSGGETEVQEQWELVDGELKLVDETAEQTSEENED